jgi:hypothetical protein
MPNAPKLIRYNYLLTCIMAYKTDKLCFSDVAIKTTRY